MQRFGRYEVIRKLSGSSGPGTQPECYLARAAGSEVAVLRRIGPAAAAAIEQAHSEVKLCNALGHEAIHATIDAFTDGDYFVLVTAEPDGCTLTRLLNKLRFDRTTIDPAAVGYLGHVVAGVLGAAHETSAGDDLVAISHGCLSPEWIGVDWDGTVRIEGLGLAPLMEAPGIRGELGYRAPEQRQAARVTPRGDIYSLAAIIWALLAGQTPPLEPRLERIAAKLPEAVRELCARALEPSLAKRKVTAAELEHAFAELSGDAGQKALANALASLRKVTSLQGTPVALRGQPYSGRGSDDSLQPAPRTGAVPLGRSSGVLPAGSSRGGKQAPADELSWGVSDDEVASAFAAVTREDEPRETSPRVKPPESSPPRRGEGGQPPGDSKPAAAAGEPVKDALAASQAIDRAVDDILADESPSWRTMPPLESLSALREPPSSHSPVLPTPPAPISDRDDTLANIGVEGIVDAPNERAPSTQANEQLPVEPPVAAQTATPEPTPERTSEPTPERTSEPTAERTSEPTAERTSEPTAERTSEPTPEPTAEPTLEPSAGSPWLSDRVAGESSKPLSLAKAVVLAAVTALGVFGFGVWWLTREQKISEPRASSAAASAAGSAGASASSDTSAGATASAAASGGIETTSTAAADSAALSASGEPTVAHGTPSASASLLDSASPSATPQPPLPAAGDDSASLPANQGHLTVTFSGEQGGEVFFLGKSMGSVTEKLTVPCDKAVFMRIGKRNAPADPPRWLTKGRTLVVACRQHNELRLGPDG